MTQATLFSPLAIGPITVPNRIAVAPMCQYSAADGCAGDWHLQHLPSLGMSGAGLVMVEATGVERRGRITHGCLGIYSDDCEAALARASRRPGAPLALRNSVSSWRMQAGFPVPSSSPFSTPN